MRTLIINGGNINYDFASVYIKNTKFDKIIAVDGGLIFADKMNIIPDYIIGDFDTVQSSLLDKYNTQSKIIKYNPIKDNTDSEIAINYACDINSTEIVIIGATGKRMDHTLANIEILVTPLRKGIEAYIIDEYNKIYLIDNLKIISKNEQYGNYVSLIPLTKVEGLTLKGFKYPLDNYTYDIGISIGISNELEAENGIIKLIDGILIAIESRD